MKVYERILTLLENKGPLAFPDMCAELNQIRKNAIEKPLTPAQIQSVITRKKDLFYTDNELISIIPERKLLSLTAFVGGFGAPSYQIKVNFNEKRFTYLEWSKREEHTTSEECEFKCRQAGDIEEFKREILALKLWEWKNSYNDKKGVILDGTSWSVQLKTKSVVYESEGIECFPSNWRNFCKIVEKLTSSPFR